MEKSNRSTSQRLEVMRVKRRQPGVTQAVSDARFIAEISAWLSEDKEWFNRNCSLEARNKLKELVNGRN